VSRVPFLDLSAQIGPLRDEMLAATARVLDSGMFALGPEVEAFEREFASLHGARHAVAVNSGTSALHLALQALGIGPGAEVIVPALTFVATAAAVRYVGARPVFADVSEDTATLDPAAVEAAITEHTRAVMPVHLYGQCAPMEPLQKVCQREGLHLIEDAAQAHLARQNGRSAGTFAAAGAFSFYPGKNLGACGEGGLVFAAEEPVAQQMRVLRDWGQSRKYHHEYFGHNYRMDALQAALLRVKLPHLAAWTQARREHAACYDRYLDGLPVQRPVRAAHNEHVYHLYTVRVRSGRDRVRAQLAERGVDTGIHYPVPVHLQPAYRDPQFPPGTFPVAERIAATTLSLPMFAELTEEQIERVATALREVLHELD
jgi:dTDP-4-amino-4,6-dideoxygalactose transaminase